MGGRWNFDADNRGSFDAPGRGLLPTPVSFAPDAVTRDVLGLVARRFPIIPGALDHLRLAGDAGAGAAALDDFIAHACRPSAATRDAMWSGEPWLYHSRLSAAMNLRLLPASAAVDAAVAAWRAARRRSQRWRGLVRQILGWREYVRGLYWLRMPGYLDDNALGADAPAAGVLLERRYRLRLPACARPSARPLRHGYAHHIQRLMVTGLFALLLGSGRAVHAWYLPVRGCGGVGGAANVLGMSQYADGGVMASAYYGQRQEHPAHEQLLQRLPLSPRPGHRGRRPVLRRCTGTSSRATASASPRIRAAPLRWRSLERLDPVQRAAIAAQAQALRARLASPA